MDPFIPFLRICTKEVIRSMEVAVGPEMAQLGKLEHRTHEWIQFDFTG